MAIKVKRKVAKAGKKVTRVKTKVKGVKLAAGKKVKKVKGLVGALLPGGAGALAADLMERGVSATQARTLAGGLRRRRSRGMFMRKGRIFMGFTQKEIKGALRRTYGGARRKK